MKKIMWIIAAVAVVFVIVGGTVEAVAFLLWVAPFLLIGAVLLFFLSRSGGRRIPDDTVEVGASDAAWNRNLFISPGRWRTVPGGYFLSRPCHRPV